MPQDIIKSEQLDNNSAYSHLLEIRQRIIKTLIIFIITFAITFYFSNNIFHFLATPLLKFLPTDAKLIATDITTPVIMPIKLALFASFLIDLPLFVYQIWKFISPALYPNEKNNLLPITISSLFLFAIGMSFAYYLVFPVMFNLFIDILPPDVTLMTDINSYLDFVIKMLIIFGVAFQIPCILLLLLKFNILKLEQITQARPYYIISAFVISMILTPPDVLSMLLLGVPICCLIELAVLLGKFFNLKR
tara:strand:+ start:20861 stop:21604 length:744 start_codon:yes stop_codon:yes gene_type:complete